MNILATLLSALVVFSVVNQCLSECNSTDIGHRSCIKHDGYDGHQWTTCVDKAYIEEKSQGL